MDIDSISVILTKEMFEKVGLLAATPEAKSLIEKTQNEMFEKIKAKLPRSAVLRRNQEKHLSDCLIKTEVKAYKNDYNKQGMRIQTATSYGYIAIDFLWQLQGAKPNSRQIYPFIVLTGHRRSAKSGRIIDFKWTNPNTDINVFKKTTNKSSWILTRRFELLLKKHIEELDKKTSQESEADE